MRKLFITGGSGFVGGHVAEKAKSSWDVSATYQSHPFDMKSVQAVGLQLEDEDLISEVIRTVKPDTVIHCAAWSDLDRCEQNPEKAYQINVKGTNILAKICAESNIRLIFTSSDMVFDGEKGNYSESDQTMPINVYGKTKQMAEQEIQSICSDYVIVRVALVYGKPMVSGNSFSEKILARLREGKSMPLYVDQFRTPIWVQTLAQGLLELAENGFTGIIHIGGPERIDRYAFGLQLAEITKHSFKLCQSIRMSEMPTIAPRPKDASLNIRLARQILHSPFIDCRQGLEHDYAFHKE